MEPKLDKSLSAAHDELVHADDDDGGGGGGVSDRSLLLRLLVVLFMSHYPTEYVVEHFLEEAPALVEAVVEACLLGLISGGLVWVMLIVPLRRSLQIERSARRNREKALLNDAHRQRFEGRLGRGVEMAESEQQVLDVLERAIVTEFEGHPAALLLADSSGSHLRSALDVSDEGSARRCMVVEPRACPAIRSGNTLVFDDPGAVDSCPQLRSAGSDTGATCVPMQAGGRAVGVLHLPTVRGVPSVDPVATTGVVAAVGRRIGMLRVMEQTSHRAETDALTGLANRRAAEDAADQLLRTGRAAVVLADLDRFKLLNDTHGHAAGDQALRLFAEVLRSVMRPEDVVARYGGEEFLLITPGADEEQTQRLVEKVREHLADRLRDAHLPAFTCSFGIADTTLSRDLAELVRLADAALYRAKRDGRDRSSLARELVDDVPAERLAAGQISVPDPTEVSDPEDQSDAFAARRQAVKSRATPNGGRTSETEDIGVPQHCGSTGRSQS